MNRRDCLSAVLSLLLVVGLPAGVSAAHVVLNQRTLSFEGHSWVVLGGGARVSVRNPSGAREYDLYMVGGVVHRDYQPFYWGRQGRLPRVEEAVTDEDRRFYAFYRQQQL